MVVGRTDTVDLVCGRQIVHIDGRRLREQADQHEHVAVDLGAGDGRFIYRLARAHPTWLCLAVDPNAQRLRETSFRAGRKPSRGGLPNARFVRAALDRLPSALIRIADTVYILLPWGSLLRAVINPEPEALRGIVLVGKPGARMYIRVNASVLDAAATASKLSVPSPGDADLESRLLPAYEACGIRVASWTWGPMDIETSWARRLNHSRPVMTLRLDATIAK